ncbi:hypothetical protein ACI8AA_04065 [Geodermatophilus sp. SYSU D01180]
MTNPGQPGTPPPAGGPQPGQPVPPQGASQPGSWQPPAGGQPGQPGAWGQPQPGQPPYGQPGQPVSGQPQPGQPAFGQPGAPGQFGPGQPGQPAPFGGPAPAGTPGKGRKIGGVVAAVAVAGGIAAFRFVDFGAPEVGDCIVSEGTSYETVGCDDSSAEARIVGVIEEKVTESEFFEDSYQPCGDFPTTTQVLWDGRTGEEGTVYCAEGI